MIKMRTLLEWSKNDPIPELTSIRRDLAIFLFGPPAVGKSTFVQDYILTRNSNFKIINPDDISALYTKDPSGEKWHGPSSTLAASMASNIAKTGGNFIYDTTGNSFDRVKNVTEIARQNHYKVVYIHMIGELSKVLSQLAGRERKVPLDYLESSYKKTQPLMHKFSIELKPDVYYVVFNAGNEYKFFKYENGKLLKRKVDKYVPVNENLND